MAHFAEVDSNNKVLRVVVGCNEDIANNGGEQSEQAAEHFKTVCPLSNPNNKWIQTSFNSNFRKNFAGIGSTWDPSRDAFIYDKPYNSWVLNETTCRWESPVTIPTDLTYGAIWDEDTLRWLGLDTTGIPTKVWNSTSLVWEDL